MGIFRPAPLTAVKGAAAARDRNERRESVEEVWGVFIGEPQYHKAGVYTKCRQPGSPVRQDWVARANGRTSPQHFSARAARGVKGLRKQLQTPECEAEGGANLVPALLSQHRHSRTQMNLLHRNETMQVHGTNRLHAVGFRQ